MIKKSIFFSTIILLLLVFYLFKLNAQDTTESCGFSVFMKWYEWKASTDLPEKQRIVVDYLKKTSDMRNKAFDTIFVNTKSQYGYPDIKEAIKIAKDALAELKEIPPPEECRRYKKRAIEEVQYVLKYHELRLKYGDGTKEFDKKHHALELAYSSRNSKSDIFSEFYICVKKIGLMDNMEEEVKKLNLLEENK